MVASLLPANRTASFIFDEVHSYNGLTPAFFVSTVMPGDHTQNSGLVGVDCYYASGCGWYKIFFSFKSET